MQDTYTIKELADILQVSKASLTRYYLKYFNINCQLVEKKRTQITIQQIKDGSSDLYYSLLLWHKNEVPKPFVTLRELKKAMDMTQPTLHRWLRENDIKLSTLGNKKVIWAVDLWQWKKKK
jgi:predicted site-specific integrase-resolvase